MKSDHENMYPFIDIDGNDYATKEEMDEANARIRAAQNFAAEAGMPRIVDPEQENLDEALMPGYQAAEHNHRM